MNRLFSASSTAFRITDPLLSATYVRAQHCCAPSRQPTKSLSFRPKRADAFSSRSLPCERVGSRSGATVCLVKLLRSPQRHTQTLGAHRALARSAAPTTCAPSPPEPLSSVFPPLPAALQMLRNPRCACPPPLPRCTKSLARSVFLRGSLVSLRASRCPPPAAPSRPASTPLCSTASLSPAFPPASAPPSAPLLP